MAVGEKRAIIMHKLLYRYIVTIRMTPALRRTAMRAILMFINCEGRDSVHRPQTLKRKEN